MNSVMQCDSMLSITLSYLSVRERSNASEMFAEVLWLEFGRIHQFPIPFHVQMDQLSSRTRYSAENRRYRIQIHPPANDNRCFLGSCASLRVSTRGWSPPSLPSRMVFRTQRISCRRCRSKDHQWIWFWASVNVARTKLSDVLSTHPATRCKLNDRLRMSCHRCNVHELHSNSWLFRRTRFSRLFY